MWGRVWGAAQRARRFISPPSPSFQLAKNPVLTEYTVQDLNTTPKLPYADASFDAVTCTVSIDYLTKPFDVVAECHRVLRPGGVMACGISNRCFPTKAVAVWTSTGAGGEMGGRRPRPLRLATDPSPPAPPLPPDDADHARIVASFFHYAPLGGWTPPAAEDVTRRGLFGDGDPMYVIHARKKE